MAALYIKEIVIVWCKSNYTEVLASNLSNNFLVFLQYTFSWWQIKVCFKYNLNFIIFGAGDNLDNFKTLISLYFI